MTSKHTYRVGLAAVATGLLSVVAIAPASATGQTSVYTDGREAGRVNYWSSTDDFRVSDTKCDGHTVHAEYQRAGASTRKLVNSGGCGTYADYNRSFTGGQSIKYRICVDYSVGLDPCSRWKWDTTG
ncbi:hypothetical protein [Streptomyces sp. TE33382]